jgi:hypothetical protein
VTIAMQTEGASRERSFDAESCQAAADAVALILAIAANPLVSASGDGRAPDVSRSEAPGSVAPQESGAVASRSQPPAPPSSAPDAAASATQTPAPMPRGPLQVAIGVSLSTDTSSLPALAAGAEVSVGWQPGPVRVEVAGTYWAPQTASVAAGAAGAHFQLLSADARVGYQLSFGGLALGPLVAVGYQTLDATGFGGTASNFSPKTGMATLGAGAILTQAIVGPVVLRVVAQGVAPLSRPTYVVNNPAPAAPAAVHRSAAIAGRALFGAEVHF